MDNQDIHLLFKYIQSFIFLLAIFFEEPYYIRIEILKTTIFCLSFFIFSQQAYQFRHPSEISLHLLQQFNFFISSGL